MINIIDLSKSDNLSKLDTFLERRRMGKNINTSIVNKIIKEVKKNKVKAVLKYEKKFNKNNKFNVSAKEVNDSIKNLDRKTKKALDAAYRRIYNFHKLQKIKNIKYIDKNKNKIEYKIVPLNNIGIYVPANLPSSLLMNAIPAKIAGVKNIVLANPRLNKKLNPAVMYVAKKCGIKNIICVGGAQAIASLAFIQKVDKIVGPGNDYVARAKRSLFGVVGTESMIAGPSEVTIIADNKTNINHILTSMVAQSEHGENSQSILVSQDKLLVGKIKKGIKKIVDNLPRQKIILKSLKKNGLIIVSKNKKQTVDIVNAISPEHLEILNKNFKFFENKIVNAGSIGIGKYSPVAASDYNVGTNHTLGTLGSAKFASGLNLTDFCKKISYFTLTKKGIEVIGRQAITLAEYENLHAHSLSIKSRM